MTLPWTAVNRRCELWSVDALSYLPLRARARQQMDHGRILIPEDELTPLTARPKKIPTVKFRIKPEPSSASAASSAHIIVLPPPPPTPDDLARAAATPRKKTGRKRKQPEPESDAPEGSGSGPAPAPMITTFDLTSPELHVNSQIPGTGSSWEHSLSSSHDAVAAARGRKKERATRKDKGVPRKKKGMSMSVCFRPGSG
jgi:hypothetical protein